MTQLNPMQDFVQTLGAYFCTVSTMSMSPLRGIQTCEQLLEVWPDISYIQFQQSVWVGILVKVPIHHSNKPSGLITD